MKIIKLLEIKNIYTADLEICTKFNLSYRNSFHLLQKWERPNRHVKHPRTSSDSFSGVRLGWARVPTSTWHYEKVNLNLLETIVRNKKLPERFTSNNGFYLFFWFFSEGTRRDNVEKNIGKRIYAFNSVQRSTLPAQYQPPVGTFGKTKT